MTFKAGLVFEVEGLGGEGAGGRGPERMDGRHRGYPHKGGSRMNCTVCGDAIDPAVWSCGLGRRRVRRRVRFSTRRAHSVVIAATTGAGEMRRHGPRAPLSGVRPTSRRPSSTALAAREPSDDMPMRPVRDGPGHSRRHSGTVEEAQGVEPLTENGHRATSSHNRYHQEGPVTTSDEANPVDRRPFGDCFR